MSSLRGDYPTLGVTEASAPCGAFRTYKLKKNENALQNAQRVQNPQYRSL
jgi:hypothetical protein